MLREKILSDNEKNKTNRFFYLSMALVDNLVFDGKKHIFIELKAYLRPPRTIL
jgi:hypothetical protein